MFVNSRIFQWIVVKSKVVVILSLGAADDIRLFPHLGEAVTRYCPGAVGSVVEIEKDATRETPEEIPR